MKAVNWLLPEPGRPAQQHSFPSGIRPGQIQTSFSGSRSLGTLADQPSLGLPWFRRRWSQRNRNRDRCPPSVFADQFFDVLSIPAEEL